jgi:hypothetical protein
MLIILFYLGTKILIFHSTRVLSTYSQFIHMLYGYLSMIMHGTIQ